MASLTVIGTVLNSFSFLCFWNITKRRQLNIYLLALSLGDIINLQVNFTFPLLRTRPYIDVAFRGLNRLCRLTCIVSEFFLIFPTWIVVLLTLEGWTFIRYPARRKSWQDRRRAKKYIGGLIIIVLALSIYRWWDSKGIDQVSVFAVLACNDDHEDLYYLSHINMILWSILPECCTLISSFIFVNRMRSGASFSKESRLGQANRIVLLVSILFMVCHTPTGTVVSFDETLTGQFSIDRPLC